MSSGKLDMGGLDEVLEVSLIRAAATRSGSRFDLQEPILEAMGAFESDVGVVMDMCLLEVIEVAQGGGEWICDWRVRTNDLLEYSRDSEDGLAQVGCLTRAVGWMVVASMAAELRSEDRVDARSSARVLLVKLMGESREKKVVESLALMRQVARGLWAGKSLAEVAEWILKSWTGDL